MFQLQLCCFVSPKFVDHVCRLTLGDALRSWTNALPRTSSHLRFKGRSRYSGGSWQRNGSGRKRWREKRKNSQQMNGKGCASAREENALAQNSVWTGRSSARKTLPFENDCAFVWILSLRVLLCVYTYKMLEFLSSPVTFASVSMCVQRSEASLHVI